MKSIEVDPKTGVPLNPEDILAVSGGVSGKVRGVPKRLLIGGLLVFLVFPLIGFFLGYMAYKNFWEGLDVAVIVFGVVYLTIRVIAWMTQEQK